MVIFKQKKRELSSRYLKKKKEKKMTFNKDDPIVLEGITMMDGKQEARDNIREIRINLF